MEVLGIDVGGSGVKGAIVNIDTGELVTNRLRIETPQPSKPDSVIEVIKEIVNHFNYQGPIGVGFPGVIMNGVTMTAANVDDEWLNYPAAEAISKATGCQVYVGNDADVAAIGEMRYGAGRNVDGVVMIFTLGTGIGSAMFLNGHIVPNVEIGHIYQRNRKLDAEYFASDRARKREDLSWKEWGARLDKYFKYIEMLFSPDLIIIGGGISKKHDKFLHYIQVRAKVVPAQLLNEAGIIGAAIGAVDR